MKNNLIWRVLMALIVLISALAAAAHPAYAQEEATNVVYCSEQENRSCEVISAEIIGKFEEEANFWMYLTYGVHNFRVNGVWYTRTVDPIPTEIHIDRDSYTSIPQMGIFWQQDSLVYNQVGWAYDNDVPLTNPNAQQVFTADELSSEPMLVTYQWDGAKTLTWNINVAISDEEIIIRVNQFMVQFMYPISQLPSYERQTYTLPADIEWVSGEELEVVAVHKFSRTVPATWTETYLWEDVSWMYEDNLSRLIAGGMNKGLAEDIVQAQFEADADQYRGTFPNYENTLWRVTWEWEDGYTFQRRDGSLIKISDDNLMTSRACTKEEHCYSRGFTPEVGQTLYVDPYTIWNIADWKDYKGGTRKDLANLRLINVSPARDILPQDWELLQKRWRHAEVDPFFATITGWVYDGSFMKIETDQGPLNLRASVSPPIGTKIAAYIYNQSASAKHYNPGELTGRVMVLFDDQGKLWFFNNSIEYGFSFDAETYSTGECGGLMTIDNWVDGCQKPNN